jgi:hypothetical protein
MSRIVRTMICAGGTNAMTITKKTMTATTFGAPHGDRASGPFAAVPRFGRHGVLLDLARAATDGVSDVIAHRLPSFGRVVYESGDPIDRAGDTACGVLIALDRRVAPIAGRVGHSLAELGEPRRKNDRQAGADCTARDEPEKEPVRSVLIA